MTLNVLIPSFEPVLSLLVLEFPVGLPENGNEDEIPRIIPGKV